MSGCFIYGRAIGTVYSIVFPERELSVLILGSVRGAEGVDS